MASLSRTMGTPTNAYKGTVSVWVKRCAFTGNLGIFNGNADVSNLTDAYFNADGTLSFYVNSGGTVDVKTTREFRDPAAWYHLVYAWDTTQGASADRLKLYVNGVQETIFSPATYPGSSQVLQTNISGNTFNVGAVQGGTGFDGNMAHFHFIDGLQYAASDFGSTDATSGIWIPNSAPSVTYGDNGLFLKFASGAMTTDSSGNSNTMSQSGTILRTKDNAMNNFCTMNPLDNYLQSMTFSQGNNTIVSDYESPATATVGVATGKWYWECKAVASSGGDFYTGVRSTQVTDASKENGYRANDWSYYGPTGNYLNNNTDTSYGDSYTVGDIIGVALDVTNSKLYFSKNGTFQNSGVPTSGATGTGAISITAVGSTPLGLYLAAAGGWSSSVDYTWSFNFGNGYFGTTAVSSSESDDNGEGSFEYDVPAGYYALCTNNLGSES